MKVKLIVWSIKPCGFGVLTTRELQESVFSSDQCYFLQGIISACPILLSCWARNSAVRCIGFTRVSTTHAFEREPWRSDLVWIAFLAKDWIQTMVVQQDVGRPQPLRIKRAYLGMMCCRRGWAAVSWCYSWQVIGRLVVTFKIGMQMNQARLLVGRMSRTV